MCGIFAAIKKNGSFGSDELESFGKSCEIINHRGPDGEGNYISNFREDHPNDSNIYLGHKRLSIIDLNAAANQPFKSGEQVIAYNGEVFNYIELKKKYLKGIEFRTSSDTEVVLEMYKKFGASCFALFNGMWAIVIYDPAKQKLIVCRDRFSIKPLFYLEQDDAIYFASEVKQFKQLNIELSPNLEIIYSFLNQGLLNYNGDTFFNEVKRFPARQYLEIDLNSWGFSWKEYWEFAPNNDAPIQDSAKAFKELLIDSLSLRLRSDVSVGTLLSGGLDSSAISVLIKSYINPEVKTFSVVSDDKKYSEENYIDLLVKEKGIANEKLRFETNLALENIDQVLEVQDQPYGSLSIVAQNKLFHQIKAETGITVLLSGQGADEILLGYSKFYFFYLKDLLKRGKLGAFSNSVASSWLKGTTLREFSFSEAKRYLPQSTNRGQEYLKDNFASQPTWAFENMRSRQILDIEKYSVPALAHYEDSNSMDASLEVRLPFLDYRMVNFMINLPVEEKLRNGWTKHLLRKSIDELPDAIRWRKDKKGFTTPEEAWMKGPLGSEMEELFSKYSILEEMGLIDRELYKKAISDFRKGSRWISHGDLFRVFITEKWLRQA